MWKRIIPAIGLTITILLATLAPTAAQSDSEAANLSISPVGTTDNYFTLEAEPGETIEVEVELTNHGSSAVSVLTYAADAYTLNNGGFGVRLSDEPVTGTTRWIDYPSETFELAGQTSTIRSVAVAIPDDAKPGDYLSALVIQNAVPTGGNAEGIGFNQVNRQAIAISIELPGPVVPGLAFGNVSHKWVTGNSVLGVEVENTGNTHMKLDGNISVTSPAGNEVFSRPVAMQTVYAGTTALLEMPVNSALDEGNHHVTLTLANDELGLAETLDAASLEVPEAPEAAIPVQPQPSTAGAETDGSTAQPVAMETVEAGIAPWMLVVGVAAALVLGAAGAGIGITLVRRKTREVQTPPVSPPQHATVSGGSGADEGPTGSPAVDPIFDAAPASQRTQTPMSRRPSTGVRNLLQTANVSRGAASNVQPLRFEERQD